MKGIVAEITGRNAIILTQDGTFKKLRANKNMRVGCEIEIDQPSGRTIVSSKLVKTSSIAAIALLVLGIGIGAYSYTAPYSYIDVDINPSIVLTVNIYDKIIKSTALNEDGASLLQNNNLKNESFDDAIAYVLSSAVEQGYLKAKSTATDSDIIENAVLFTVSSGSVKKSERLKEEIYLTAFEELEKDNVNSEILIGKASVKQRDDALKIGVSPGKLALIEDAMEGESELKLDELKGAAVKDLIKIARDKQKEKEKEEKEKTKEQKGKEKEQEKKQKEQEKEQEKGNKEEEQKDKEKEEKDKEKEEKEKTKEQKGMRDSSNKELNYWESSIEWFKTQLPYGLGRNDDNSDGFKYNNKNDKNNNNSGNSNKGGKDDNSVKTGNDGSSWSNNSKSNSSGKNNKDSKGNSSSKNNKDSKGSSSSKNNSNSWSNRSNSGKSSNDKSEEWRIMSDTLHQSKEKWQQLKDELLEQIKDYKSEHKKESSKEDKDKDRDNNNNKDNDKESKWNSNKDSGKENNSKNGNKSKNSNRWK